MPIWKLVEAHIVLYRVLSLWISLSSLPYNIHKLKAHLFTFLQCYCMFLLSMLKNSLSFERQTELWIPPLN